VGGDPVAHKNNHKRESDMHDMERSRTAVVWQGGKGNAPDHPHQIWLRSDRTDPQGIREAFHHARADLPEWMIDEVLEWCDNAQYHFITRLIFRHGYLPDGSVDYVDTPKEAFDAAQREQEVYLGSK
jgi:hypothetical protein